MTRMHRVEDHRAGAAALALAGRRRIDEVPDPAARRDVDLPADVLAALEDATARRTFEGVLTAAVVVVGLRGELVVDPLRFTGHLLAQLVPRGCHLLRPRDDVPVT